MDLKNSPKECMASFRLSAKSSDDFLSDIIDVNPEKAVEAFRKLVMNRTCRKHIQRRVHPSLDE